MFVVVSGRCQAAAVRVEYIYLFVRASATSVCMYVWGVHWTPLGKGCVPRLGAGPRSGHWPAHLGVLRGGQHIHRRSKVRIDVDMEPKRNGRREFFFYYGGRSFQ